MRLIRITNKYLVLCVLLLNISSCRQNHTFELQNGDVIFQQSVTSDFESAISQVTQSKEGYMFTHVGIVYIDPEGRIYVIEATPPEVTITPIEKYLSSKDNETPAPISVVGRLKEEYRQYIPEALKIGLTMVGAKYDYAFTLNDDKYYCSELIYEILKRSAGGMEIFQLNKMTFKLPEIDKIADNWHVYYEELGIPIPEGELGINPGAMSQSDVIEIVHRY